MLSQSSEFFIARSGFRQQPFHVRRSLRHFVISKLEGWGKSHRQGVAYEFAQLATVALECLRRLVEVWFLVDIAAAHRVIHRRVVLLSGRTRISDGDEFQAAVLNVVLERIGDDLLDSLRDPSRTCIISHDLFTFRFLFLPPF